MSISQSMADVGEQVTAPKEWLQGRCSVPKWRHSTEYNQTTINSSYFVLLVMANNKNCCRCKEELHGSFFELIHKAEGEHKHFACPACLALLHCNRGCQPYFECPSAGCQHSVIIRHYIWQKSVLSSTRQKRNLSVSEERQQPAVYMKGATSKELDPNSKT